MDGQTDNSDFVGSSLGQGQWHLLEEIPHNGFNISHDLTRLRDQRVM